MQAFIFKVHYENNYFKNICFFEEPLMATKNYIYKGWGPFNWLPLPKLT